MLCDESSPQVNTKKHTLISYICLSIYITHRHRLLYIQIKYKSLRTGFCCFGWLVRHRLSFSLFMVHLCVKSLYTICMPPFSALKSHNTMRAKHSASLFGPRADITIVYSVVRLYTRIFPIKAPMPQAFLLLFIEPVLYFAIQSFSIRVILPIHIHTRANLLLTTREQHKIQYFQNILYI